MKKEFWDKQKGFIRGRIIDKSIDLEEKISNIIKDFFCDEKLSYFFKEEVLDKEFFTFFQKTNILKKIIKRLGLLDEEEIKKYNKLINECIVLRNKLAHGKIGLPTIREEEITFTVEENGDISEDVEIVEGGDKFTFYNKKGKTIKEQQEYIEYDKINDLFDETLKFIKIVKEKFDVLSS